MRIVSSGVTLIVTLLQLCFGVFEFAYENLPPGVQYFLSVLIPSFLLIVVILLLNKNKFKLFCILLIICLASAVMIIKIISLRSNYDTIYSTVNAKLNDIDILLVRSDPHRIMLLNYFEKREDSRVQKIKEKINLIRKPLTDLYIEEIGSRECSSLNVEKIPIVIYCTGSSGETDDELMAYFRFKSLYEPIRKSLFVRDQSENVDFTQIQSMGDSGDSQAHMVKLMFDNYSWFFKEKFYNVIKNTMREMHEEQNVGSFDFSVKCSSEEINDFAMYFWWYQCLKSMDDLKFDSLDGSNEKIQGLHRCIGALRDIFIEINCRLVADNTNEELKKNKTLLMNTYNDFFVYYYLANKNEQDTLYERYDEDLSTKIKINDNDTAQLYCAQALRFLFRISALNTRIIPSAIKVEGLENSGTFRLYLPPDTSGFSAVDFEPQDIANILCAWIICDGIRQIETKDKSLHIDIVNEICERLNVAAGYDGDNFLIKYYLAELYLMLGYMESSDSYQSAINCYNGMIQAVKMHQETEPLSNYLLATAFKGLGDCYHGQAFKIKSPKLMRQAIQKYRTSLKWSECFKPEVSQKLRNAEKYHEEFSTH